MAALYSDEMIPIELIQELRTLGHDVLRAYEDDRANQGIPDPNVLKRAIELGRTVVTTIDCTVEHCQLS